MNWSPVYQLKAGCILEPGPEHCWWYKLGLSAFPAPPTSRQCHRCREGPEETLPRGLGSLVLWALRRFLCLVDLGSGLQLILPWPRWRACWLLSLHLSSDVDAGGGAP